MIDKNPGGKNRWFIGLIAFCLFFAFASLTYASRDEFDKVKNDIWTKGRRWVANETEITRLADKERKMRLGLLTPPSGTTASAPETAVASSVITGVAPASFDWRNVNGYSYVTAVKNQGNCGSCWAFAITAALESNVLISAGINANLAEQILVSCGGAGSCNGGYITTASNFIRDTGLSAESYYPYLATNGVCANAISGWQNATSRITSWHYVGNTTNPTISQVKDELVTYGPLVTTMSVYSDFFYYSGGVYEYTSGTYQGGHAVLIVGYDDVGQYFIVKNSWGSSWGESGYFRIGYSEFNSVTNFGDWSLAYYTDTAPPGIRVSAPNGGESLGTGTTKTIQWNYTGTPGSTVKIDLYNNGVFDRTIASSVSVGSGGAGSYSWSIPATLAAGGFYQIVVTSNQDLSYTDESDNYFTITAYVPPTITVTSPSAAGISWTRNTIQKITWAYTGAPGSHVKIELLKGTTSVNVITSNANITAGYSYWKVPARQTLGNDYKIRITSTTNGAYTDTGDNAFRIK